MPEPTQPADQTTAHPYSHLLRVNHLIATGDINCSICANPLSPVLQALPPSHPLRQTTSAATTTTCPALAILPCGHHFGRPCIATWLQHSDLPTCPLCRAPVPLNAAAPLLRHARGARTAQEALLDRVDAVAKAPHLLRRPLTLTVTLSPPALCSAARRLEALLRALPARAARLTRGAAVPEGVARLPRLLRAVCEAAPRGTGAPRLRARDLPDLVVTAMWAEEGALAEAAGEAQVVDGQETLDVVRFVERMVAMILLEEEGSRAEEGGEGDDEEGFEDYDEEEEEDEEDWETDDEDYDGEDEEEYGRIAAWRWF